MMGTSVKTERHDDHEINELARKIAEQNRNKVHQQQQQAQHRALPQHMQMAGPGQPMIQNYLANGRAQQQTRTTSSSSEERKIDAESRKGRFGWCEFEKNYLPFIFRGGGDRYTSVRMVERKLLSRYLSMLPPEVNSCHCIRSYYITDNEAKLLNEINLKHTDCFFGKDAFTTKDLVVKLKDAKEFYKFLDLCFKKLVLKKSNASDKCGFFRINGESVVPYTVRDTVKFVPLFYFEGETDHLKLKSDQVDGWDLAYLKFCCKVQGIRNELFASETCRVVALDEIKGHFPQGTTFEDYWPAKGSIEPVNQQRNPVGNWTQKPPTSTPSNNTSAATNGVSRHHQAQSQSQHSMNAAAAAAAAAAVQQHAAVAAAAQRPMSSATLDAHLLASNPAYYQQYLGSLSQGLSQVSQLQQQQMALAYGQALSSSSPSKQFPGKLTQMGEFPMERTSQPPYKLQKALIDQKIVPCINVRPYVFHDLMMTFPDFMKHFSPDLSMDQVKRMLQDILKIVLYKGNSGHQEVLRSENKCSLYDPVPLVLVKDIMNYMSQIKLIISQQVTAIQQAKRMRLT